MTCFYHIVHGTKQYQINNNKSSWAVGHYWIIREHSSVSITLKTAILIPIICSSNPTTKIVDLWLCSLSIRLLLRNVIPPATKYLTQAIRAINITESCQDILSSSLIAHPPSTLSDLVDCYKSTLLTNMHLSNLKSPALNLVILGLKKTSTC